MFIKRVYGIAGPHPLHVCIASIVPPTSTGSFAILLHHFYLFYVTRRSIADVGSGLVRKLNTLHTLQIQIFLYDTQKSRLSNKILLVKTHLRFVEQNAFCLMFVASSSQPSLHSFVGIHNPSRASTCRNHWLRVQHNCTLFCTCWQISFRH